MKDSNGSPKLFYIPIDFQLFMHIYSKTAVTTGKQNVNKQVTYGNKYDQYIVDPELNHK